MSKELVEIVRCKNCVHRPDKDGYPPEDDYLCPCVNPGDEYYSYCPEDDWFCAEGEEKEIDKNE